MSDRHAIPVPDLRVLAPDRGRMGAVLILAAMMIGAAWLPDLPDLARRGLIAAVSNLDPFLRTASGRRSPSAPRSRTLAKSSAPWSCANTSNAGPRRAMCSSVGTPAL